MRNIFIIIFVGGIVLLVGVMFYVNQQRQTAQQNADVERKLRELSDKVAAQSQPTTFVSQGAFIAPTTGDSVLARQKLERDAMKEGWDLVNRRDRGSAETAIALFKEAIDKIDPKEAQFYNGLGRASLIAGKPQDAIAAWEQGLTIDPTVSDMQSGIGWAWWHLGDPYRAKVAWEKALAMNATSPDAWSAMAWIYLALGERDKSRRGFQYLIAHNKENQTWVFGLNLAQADNRDPNAIGKYFKLPPLDAFNPPASASAPR